MYAKMKQSYEWCAMYYDIFIMKEHESLNPDYEPCNNT